MEVTIIFPNQLFREHPAVISSRKVFLVEEYLFFKQYNFLKQRLIYQRACMKTFEEHLKNNGCKVSYIDTTSRESDVRKLIMYLKEQNVSKVHCIQPNDDWLNKRLQNACKRHSIEIIWYESKSFLNELKYVSDYKPKNGNYYHANFYIDQRKLHDVLIDGEDPIGGKWSFDTENRKKLPKNKKTPTLDLIQTAAGIDEAKEYVEKNFADNIGSKDVHIAGKSGYYPTTHRSAKQWLHTFLDERLSDFGTYQDAIHTDEQTMYHSLLTPMLNIGLLTPRDILDATLKHAEDHEVKMNSLEGFLRQVLGWREFMRLVYIQKGSFQRTNNYWNFKNRNMPDAFYDANTGVAPVDHVIKNVLKTGYAHHIERLMVLGNFMLLCEVHPNKVYQWFMELFVDAYDWVMVPNVYGMSQYADGGLITTKPYISSSNYIKKMSNYGNGEWRQIWDGLFWRFIAVYRDTFEKNHRMSMMMNMWDKMNKTTKDEHLNVAEKYLDKLWG